MSKRKIPDVSVSSLKQDEPKVLTSEEVLDPAQETTRQGLDSDASARYGIDSESKPVKEKPIAPKKKNVTKDVGAADTSPSWRARLGYLQKTFASKTGIALICGVSALAAVAIFFATYKSNRGTLPESTVSSIETAALLDTLDTKKPSAPEPQVAAAGILILELSKNIRTSEPFDRQLETTVAASSDLRDNKQISTLLSFIEPYAYQGVPDILELRSLLPALQLEVEVFSGLESPSYLRQLFLSAWSLVSDNAKVEINRVEKTKAVFAVTDVQLGERSLEGAISALSYLEPAQKEVARGLVELLRARLSLDRTADKLEHLALGYITD